MELVIVPRNGLANRLRALASARFLAERLGVPLKMAWTPCSAIREGSSVVFEKGLPWETMEVAHSVLGVATREFSSAPVPKALRQTYLRSGRDVIIVGNRWGEQWAVNKFLGELENGLSPNRVTIISGGNFFPRGAEAIWLTHKSDAYREIEWNADVLGCARDVTSRRSAIHLRFGDLAGLAPPPRALSAAIRSAEEHVPREVVVFSDDYDRAQEYVREIGEWVTAVRAIDLDTREQCSPPSTLVAASADWVSMTEARAVFHFAHSSFGEEAGIAAGMAVAIESRKERWITLGRAIRARY